MPKGLGSIPALPKKKEKEKEKFSPYTASFLVTSSLGFNICSPLE
jgi:hypothetical protein